MKAMDGTRSFVGVVLTGGQSTRMGRDKAQIALDGVPMAVRAARTLQEAGAVAVVGVGGDPAVFAAAGLRTVPDRWPGEGPLGGVITALEGAEGTDVVVLSCDTPFVSAATVRALARDDEAADVVAAATPAQEHLLVACYSARCLSTLRTRFDAGERAVHRAARGLQLATVLVDDHEVFNVNSPADLSDAERRAARPGGPIDRRGRPLADLRLSVTDRCNLRCSYCMPEQTYTWLPRDEILTFEEIGRLVDAFLGLGVRKVRLTGGEPLLRKDLSGLVALLAQKQRVEDLAMTTNGVLLAEHVDALRAAGLGRVTVSLDTLRPDRFEALSRRSTHDAVLRGLRSVTEAGFTNTKIDTVVMRGINDDELVDLVEFAARVPAEVRFIEYMDVGGATRWNPDAVVSRDTMLATLEAHYGPIAPLPGRDAAPADRYQIPDGTTFGIIASTTAPFCATCDRSRVTADGMWYGCLYAPGGTDLRTPLRAGAGRDELQDLITGIWTRRSDQGAVEREHERTRGPVFPVSLLQRDPHLEMHTRGG